jgi:hypothetical protein
VRPRGRFSASVERGERGTGRASTWS